MALRDRWVAALLFAAILCACPNLARADDAARVLPSTFSLGAAASSMAQESSGGSEETPTTLSSAEEVQAAEEEKPFLPFTFNITYYLMSDYVFRGVNLSEFAEEGSETPNHQFTSSLAIPLGDYGTFGFDTFWEIFPMQEKINPFTHGDLQEFDWTFWWSHEIEQIATEFTLGFTGFEFPGLGRLLRRTQRDPGKLNDVRTHEWWFSLAHNDAWMWKWLWPDNDEGVLNPSFFFAQDVGITGGGRYAEIGFNHPFPIIENLTVTPSWTVAMESDYWQALLGRRNNSTTRFLYQQLGLDVTYELGKALKLPRWAGSLALSGLLYFNDAWGNAEDDHTIQDELFGGFAVSWTIGE